MSAFKNVMFFIALASVVIGCADQPAVSDEASHESADQGASSPAAAFPPGTKVARGTVVETMDAASYTYVLVDAGGDEIWAAATRFEVAVGDTVTVPLEMPMQDFHSEALDRDFSVVYFASRILVGDEAAVPAAPVSRGAPVPERMVDEGPIEPVDGGVTVARVWAERDALAQSSVTVRGRVVKYNPGILGRNWLHIQDGSGSAEQGTHDLTVTSSEGARVGSVVTVSGVVAVDQDFGAGYSYPVMLTDAAIDAE
jgi:hypothetical protein